MRIKHKYGAKKVDCDDKKFDSKLEWRYYNKLKILQSSEDIVFFLRQVPFDLPGGVKYRADFMEFWKDGTVRIVDCKGFDTPASKLKRKQVEDIYPVKIEIVTAKDI